MRAWVLVVALLAALVAVPGAVLVFHQAPPATVVPPLPPQRLSARAERALMTKLVREGYSGVTCTVDPSDLTVRCGGDRTHSEGVVVLVPTAS
jgi:hypothetical protein